MDLTNIDISKLSFSEKFYLKCISDGVKGHEFLPLGADGDFSEVVTLDKL